MQTNKADKAIKAARLAYGAGTEGEANAAGYRAGQLAYAAGMECEALWQADAPSAAWGAIVDGYYDAKEASHAAA